jgi:hypothetical protein
MKNALLSLVLIISGVLIVLMQFGFIFLLLAMMPSIVAYYVDAHPRKTSFKIVFAGNISAALPTLMPMIRTGLNMRPVDVVSVVQDPSVWMFIYLGAGAGWALIYLCKYIARFVVTMSFEYSIKTLENEQQMLVEEWGEDITQIPTAQEQA